VGTNWTNPAFPLIRYDTGDLASGVSNVQRGARSERSVESIDGRKEDYITLPNGIRLGRLDHIFKDFVDICEAQIYQPVENTIVIRIVKGQNYTNHTESQLLKEAQLRIGRSVDIEFEYLDRIARTKSGKLRFVVSKVGLHETNSSEFKDW
jgi:phenylacetate-CoA ligase